MARVQVDTFREHDIGAAAQLLAERQLRARLVQPALPASYEKREAWLPGLTEAARAGGLAARDQGRLVGFMLGREELQPHDSMAARWGDARAGVWAVDRHAVAANVDVLAVYLAMYAAQSEAWVRRGYFSHVVHVMAADVAAHDAFVAMGFGRRFVAGVRLVEPLPPLSESVAVREATADDRKAIHQLEEELDMYHTRAPIFLPMDPATNAAAAAFQDSVIDDSKNAIFLAEQDGKPVGMNSLLRESVIPKCVLSERSVYLYQGIVGEAARSGGIGEALLARSLRWARDGGHDQVALHYFSANPAGGAFWRKQGFVAVEYAMSRAIDPRIAWARDRH